MALPANFVETALQRYEEARSFWRNWRAGARDDYAFISGNQWLSEDEAILRDQKRPPITFNYSEKMIDAVVGAEVSNRQEIIYAPRTVDDAPATEMWTNACKWIRDQGNIEDEETDAFRDALICGMGWTHTKVAYDTDSQGMIETHRKDPLSLLSDPSARKPGLIDRRYSFCDEWVDEKEAKKQWPNAVMYSTDSQDSGRGVQTVRQGHHYEEDNTDDDADAHKGQVQVRHYECVELVPYYKVATENSTMDVEASAFSNLRKELDEKGIRYVKMYKRTYYYAYFAGETFLEGDLSPTQKGFTYQCITGKRDRNKNTWYGLTRVMKDPQRWANKWLSQILHIINSNAKGGLLAEQNAFLDPKKAQDEWAMPESITLLKEGGIAKIKEKTMTSYPQGLDRLMEFALSSLPQVTGINLEALGLASREQANVLEQSRKQAAYGLLAPVFDSLRRYRKNQGRILLDFINTYLSDGRMIRIGGPESKEFVKLTKVPGAMEYDVIIDQAPTSPDVKRETWHTLETLIPAAMKAGIRIPPTILKYAPIPTALALEWQQTAQQSQTSPQEVEQMQQQMQQMQQQNQQLQQQLRDKAQELQLKAKEAALNLKLEERKMILEHELAMRKLEQEYELKTLQVNQEIKLNYEKAQADTVLKRQKQEEDADIARQKAKSQPASKD